MLGCIYQLWDWLEAPPLFNAATMDAKKLQQLQQAQHLQKKIPLAYQTNIADYRTATHSPVFQQQQHGNYHMAHMSSSAAAQQYQQSPTTTSSSGPLTPIDIQPHASKLLLKHQLQSSGSGGSSAHSSPYHQASTSSGYPTSSTGGTGGTDQLYQSPTERTYLAAAGRIPSSHNQATNLQLQYQQLQQAKLQAQLATQNEAVQNQQRTFAMRQVINPPVPQGHYHMSQSSSMMSTITQQSQQQQQQHQQQQQQQQQQAQQRAPPSSLNLTNQFQPAAGPLKVTQQNAHKSAQQHYHQQQQQQQQQEQIYGQHQHQQLQMQLHHQQQLQQQHHHALQQRSKSDLQTPVSSDQSPIYIQQNHPGHVVNQAVQTQISTVAKSGNNPQQITKTPSSEESSSASTKSPSHAVLERKKSAGASISNAQALKSPITKRPPNSPVTISGWLYKQGSDGLKVWRKRWFVLAEYCLYYYKGPEEEKVLGSILLPSYKVSACLPEDKIYRKFAFKCEHQNMRTYWLAAENAESMVQWVRALSAATMMQAPHITNDSSEQPSGSSSQNHSGENSDSGIHTLQSQQSKMSGQGQVTPASDNGGVTTSSSSGAGGGTQPLYANAPPKPRRITDGGYSSPSPEHSIDNERIRQHQTNQMQQQQQQQHHQQQTSRRSGIMSPTLQQMQQYQQQHQQQQSRSQHHAIYDTRTGNVSSAVRIPSTQQSNYNMDALEAQYQQQLQLSPEDYPQSPPGTSSQYMDAQMEQQIMQLQQQRVAVDDIYGERELYMQRLIQQRYPPHLSAYVAAAERRTPDAYGRSKNRMFSDYEDIYNLTAGLANTSAQEALMQEAASYRRPLSPPSYDGNKHVPSLSASRYTPNHLESSPGHNAAGSNTNLRARPVAAIVRPHSADFLEYEARAEAAADAAAIAATASMVKPDPVRAPRPKSSLDINRTPDSFYYSEENYAEKMRKSALYLQNPQAQPQQAGNYRTASGSSDFLSPVASGMNTIAYENPYERTYKRNELLQDALGNQAGHTIIPRMSRSQTMGNGSQIRSSSTHPHNSQSPPQQQLQNSSAYQQKQTSQSSLLSSGLTTQQIIQQNEQFLRSASARLPKRTSTFDDEPPPSSSTNTALTTTATSPPTGTTSPTTGAGSGGAQTPTTSHLDGERKREESMKRLLEWKQRMLQSPLTRKSAQHATSSAAATTAATQSGQTTNNGNSSNMSAMSKLGSNPNILLASTAIASGAHYPHTSTASTTSKAGVVTPAGVTKGIQRSRSETHANAGPTAGYNSYSSDDEAGMIAKAPAGRSSSLRGGKTYKISNNTKTKSNITTFTSTTSNNITTTTTSTTTTTQKTQVLTTSGSNTAGGHTLENYTTTSNLLYNDNTIKPKKMIAIKDKQQQRQQQQQLDEAKNVADKTLMTSLTKTLTDPTLHSRLQTHRILKPILKTKIINVKPITSSASSSSSSFFQSEFENSLDLNLSLPKIPNAIEIPLDEENSLLLKSKDNLEPTSPQISSYVPVYSTKTVTPSKVRTLSNNYENIEIQCQDTSKDLKNKENSTKDVEFSTESEENSTEGVETSEKDLETSRHIVESSAKDLEISAKDVENSTKDVENSTKVVENYTKCAETSENMPNLFKTMENFKNNVNSPKYVESFEKDPKNIASDTEAIQDAEATPMLMSLKRFKEKEEKRQKLKLNLEQTPSKEEELTPTQDSINKPTLVNISGPADEDQEEDEDTTCEYTDDDLDEALAEEADVEEESTMDLTQDLTDEQELLKIYQNEPMTPLEAQHNLDESHYLPMTPKKIESDPAGTLTLVSMLDSNNEEDEENHYVEMTKQLQEDESKNNYEIMCINTSGHMASSSNSAGCKPKHLKVLNEPLYMELQNAKTLQKSAKTKADSSPMALLPLGKTSTLKKSKKSSDTPKKKSKKSQQDRNQHKRKDLPDILKPSQSSMALNSDSSDADDESSKHLDAKKMRSRSRFSLSDTFRPASYYLGASTPLNDCIESSDSEIVSPPPIPNSPPPMEELKTEEIFSAENYDTVKRRDSNSGSKFNISYEQLPKIHASNTSLNLPKNKDALKSSRLSLPDQFSKVKNLANVKTPQLLILKQHERTLSDSNYSFQTDNSSNTSSDFDLYNKLKQNSPSYIATPIRYQSNSSLTLQQKSSLPGTGNNSETDTVELRQRQGSDSELERQRSRRPLSEESISEIESLSEKFEDCLENADLDTYLNDLQNSDLYLYQNTKFEPTTSTNTILTDAAAAQGAGILTNLIKPPKIFRNQDDEHFYGNIHFVSSTDSLQKLETHNDPNDLIGATSLTPTRYMTPLHSRNNSNISEQSVPYYYSDLSSSRELLTTPTTLNNQKDIHAPGSNIDHIHNPIERAHNINMEILADKDQAIDSKNLYKMKTNIEKLSYSSSKNLKTGEQFQSNATNSSMSLGPQTKPSFHIQQLQNPTLKMNNYKSSLLQYQQNLTAIYNTGNTLASNSQTILTPPPTTTSGTTPSIPSLSLSTSSPSCPSTTTTPSISNMGSSGINDINAKNINFQMGQALVAQNSPQNSNNSLKTKDKGKINNNLEKSSTVLGGPGELLWEEDTLWRESLRRVSQRHARSLDDLDRINITPTRSAPAPHPQQQHQKSLQYDTTRKPRLSRDVTYVNDNVSQHLRSSFKLRHADINSPSSPITQRTYDEVCPDVQSIIVESLASTNDHDVYVQLTENPEDMNAELYEVLREETSSNISSNKSAEIDRETIRQWDSMSSGLMKNSANSEQSPTTTNVKSIIDQLNANCDNNGNPNIMASISVRNVRNLPKGNLTVKPDPSDPQLQQHQRLLQQQQQYNYDQMQKLENSYYGTAHDMKYAKTTILTDRNATGGRANNTDISGGGGLMDTGTGGGTYVTSTPLHHRSSNGMGVHDYYGTSGNIYDMHNGYQQQQQQQQHLQQLHQQQQQLLSHPMRRVGSRAEIDMLERETSSQIRNLDVSAGDLLSRTHEELVLLLIQLRRQNSNTARAIEQCCTDIHDVQNRLRTAEGLTRAESIQRLDYLKQHLLDLERQYEKSKPLVNLVDNMVKLGSLYRNDANGRTQPQRPEAVTLDRLEFNQRIQEKRLLQEEQKQWDRLNPDHNELQSKVRQLYHLDQLLQEESGTLQNLQRDKEDLERALGGLKARIQDTSGPPLALEAAKKQQLMLEHELSRVHQLLAENSKKLEQTVAGNSRLEQELLVLRQKLQTSRGSQSALQVSDTYTSNTTAMLESELKRVQTLVGDMQRQRQELSSAVKQLTENSNRLYQEIGNKEHGGGAERNGGRSGETSNNGSIKKRTNSGCWIETDLDTMMCVNRTLSDSTMNLSTPLYVDTSSNNTSGNLLNCSTTSSKLSDYNTGDSMTNESQRRMNSTASYRYNDSSDNLETSGVDSDGFLESNPFANLSQQEKQEIKTVRIVKRESERRHRDRSERTGTGLSNSTLNLDQVLEEEQYNLMNGSGHINNVIAGVGGVIGNYHNEKYQTNERSKSLPRTYNEPPTKSSSSSSRHHHRHKHGSSGYHSSTGNTSSSSIHSYNDYYGHNGPSNVYDKNSNYSNSHHHQQPSHLTNGHNNSQPREHLNPLANAYFAKQIQQQTQHQHHQSTTNSHHNHHPSVGNNSSSSHSRHSSQSALRHKTDSVQSLNKSLSDLTPSFQSEAARQIMNEMSAGSASEDTEKVQEKVPSQHKHRRAVPKEKRRHYTAPNNVVNVKTIENGQTENDMNRNNTNWRARDDLDMEVALRPRMNAPDVVRSALRHGEKISENTIDNLLLAPNKIVIPERYIPETTPELSPEEKKRRQEKVESIKKMLSEAPISSANETTASLPPSKINEEKKQREHLLQLNQILAQQVMQMSKIVAEKAMSNKDHEQDNDDDYDYDDDDDEEEEEDADVSPNGDDNNRQRKSESTNQSLPLYQQRDNFYS